MLEISSLCQIFNSMFIVLWELKNISMLLMYMYVWQSFSKCSLLGIEFSMHNVIPLNGQSSILPSLHLVQQAFSTNFI